MVCVCDEYLDEAKFVPGLVEGLEDHRLGSQLGFKELEEQVIGAAYGSPLEESLHVG